MHRPPYEKQTNKRITAQNIQTVLPYKFADAPKYKFDMQSTNLRRVEIVKKLLRKIDKICITYKYTVYIARYMHSAKAHGSAA